MNVLKARQLKIIALPGDLIYGSSVMRCSQLCEMVQPFFEEGQVELSDHLDHHNSLIWLSKKTHSKLSYRQIWKLRKQGNIILADIVDGRPSWLKNQLMHGLIAASIEAFESYKRKYPNMSIFYVRHHVDPRLPLEKSLNEFKIGYIGEVMHMVRDPLFEDKIEKTYISYKDQGDGFLNAYKDINCHYAVRPKIIKGMYKPFTKGFTAAQTGSNIIINSAATDAKHFLGDDYPFLLPDSPTSLQIAQMIDFAQSEFGSSIWNQGLEKMREIKAHIEPANIAQDVADIIKHYS